MLQEWLSGRAVTSMEGRPEEVDRPQTLYNLCKAVDFLHARSLVHGCLAPDALMWFAPLKQWKLIGFGNWAKSQEPMRISYDLRYAAPELLHADLVGVSLPLQSLQNLIDLPGSASCCQDLVDLNNLPNPWISQQTLCKLSTANRRATNLSDTLERRLCLIVTKNQSVTAF